MIDMTSQNQTGPSRTFLRAWKTWEGLGTGLVHASDYIPGWYIPSSHEQVRNFTNNNNHIAMFNLVSRPFHLYTNIHMWLIFYHSKSEGKSGQFGDVMVMSHGHGLNIYTCSWFELCGYTLLTAQALLAQSAFSSLALRQTFTVTIRS